ncbi:endonuclease NucS [Methanobrevibacter cuticularis]|uniref:Endonuclease NucS n=1 Tax=Methanobrevibacter cuticularis TaxID=47311 RepID=A0A166D895_9EURY|nr:endonuclease NucS [Methanobrevibacter cuticularis]KZX15309.1 endonuclease NucS [Methanobrevibacter cuticularis]
MKYKLLENPNIEEMYDLIEEGLRKKAMINVFCCCKVIYEGRALSQLDFGERMILLKPDGSFLIHQERKVDPVNWQPPKSRTRTFIKDNTLFLESHRRSPKERLEVEIKKTHFVNYVLVEDYQELEIAGYEKDMGDMIMKHPHMIEEGFKPTDREYSTEHGFIDILGKDKEGNLMVLELKCRKAGINAVKQIRRYLTDFKEEENSNLENTGNEKKKVRGLLVAPSIGEDARELLEEENIEFKSIDPPKELKNDKKVTLDIF